MTLYTLIYVGHGEMMETVILNDHPYQLLYGIEQ